MAGGKVYAVWNFNENSDYFGANNTNRIYASELAENGWSAPQILADNLNAVTRIETGAVNNSLCVVYITDNDNDITTSEDRTLNAINTYDGQIYELAFGNIDSTKFAKAVDDDKKSLYWYEDGNLVKTDNLTFKSRVISEAPETLSSNFEILGNRILWSGSVDGTVYAVMNRNNITIKTNAVESENSIVFTAFDDYLVINKLAESSCIITISSQIEGLPVTAVGDNLFKGLSGVTYVYFPATVKEIGSCTSMNSSVHDIRLTAYVKKIGNNAFYNSGYGNNLKSEFVVLGNGVLYAYNGTADEVIIPSNVKKIGEDAFSCHSEITPVTFTSDITDINGVAFYKYLSLTKVEFPDTVKNIAVGAFADCSALKTIVTGTDIEFIHTYAFHLYSYCYS